MLVLIKSMLFELIEPNKGIFIQGCIIVGNVVVVLKIFHSIITKDKWVLHDQDFVALKLDTSKSYDCLN